MVDLNNLDEHYFTTQLNNITPTGQKWLKANESDQQAEVDQDYSRSRKKTKVAHLPIDEYPDVVITKSQPSAFNDTPLLQLLRTSLVTDIYFCGSLNHGSIYATAKEAAGHGFKISMVEDCVGFTNLNLQQEAMETVLGASSISSQEIIAESSGQVPVKRIQDLISPPEIIRSGFVPSFPLDTYRMNM